MIFRPDIKPLMWGPPEDIRFAVRVNAERAALDYDKLTFLQPFWSLETLEKYYESQAYSRNIILGGNAKLTGEGLETSSGYANLNSYIGEIAEVNESLTLFFRCTPSVIGTTDRSIFSRWGSSVTYYQFRTWIDVDGAGVGYAGAIHDGSAFKIVGTDTSNAAVNKTASVALTFKKSGFLRIFVDGVNTSSIAVGGNLNATPITSPFALGSDGGNSLLGTPFAGTIHIAGAYNGEINAAQIAQLHATPYALLMPVSRPVYFDLATGNTNSSADPGNIAIAGSSATGIKTSVSSANSGTVAIAGSVASGIRSLVSLATAASIAIAGFSAEGVYTPTGSTVSSAGAGVVAIAGAPATGIQTHISSADPGAIAIVGNTANAATGYASIAEPGTVAIIGTDATASRTYVATASPTAIAITGSPAYATKSGGSSTSSGISLIFGKVILHL